MRVEVMSIPFDSVTMEEALQAAFRLMERKAGAYCVTPNAEMVYEAQRDDSLRQYLCQADLVLPDGAGVVLGAKILSTPVKEKVAGIEFGEQLMKRFAGTEKTVYFLGGKPGVAEQAAKKLQEKYPGLRIVGTRDGYFTDEEKEIALINEASPDLLLVCLGFPKQESFMYHHRNEVKVGLMAGLGGSLDIYAGVSERAPQWMINLSLEWLYRLIREPKRIGRVMRLPKFLLMVIARRLKG